MNHGHDIDGMLAGDGVSARALRLHLDNSHDERTTGWDFARLHALHRELHGPRLAEIEAAANLIAERLAAAEPAVVESVFTSPCPDVDHQHGCYAAAVERADEELAMKRALQAFGWEVGPEFLQRYHSDSWVFNLANAVVRLTAEVERLRKCALCDGIEDPFVMMVGLCYRHAADALVGPAAIARGAELARAFNAADRALKMSGDLASSDTAGGVGASPGAAPPAAPFKHVWTCRLKAGDETCECEAYAQS